MFKNILDLFNVKNKIKSDILLTLKKGLKDI